MQILSYCSKLLMQFLIIRFEQQNSINMHILLFFQKRWPKVGLVLIQERLLGMSR